MFSGILKALKSRDPDPRIRITMLRIRNTRKKKKWKKEGNGLGLGRFWPPITSRPAGARVLNIISGVSVSSSGIRSLPEIYRNDRVSSFTRKYKRGVCSAHCTVHRCCIVCHCCLETFHLIF
jgi:hypothetical protein